MNREGKESAAKKIPSDPARYLPLIIIGGGISIGMLLYYLGSRGSGPKRNIIEEIRDPSASIAPV